MNLRVYIYSRVATSDDDRIAYQKKNLDSFCSQKGYQVVRSYSDVSPDHEFERPGLNDMLNNLEDVEAIVVYSMDRLTRSEDHFDKIRKRLKKHDIKLLTIF